jgi:hypothetical protein
MAVMSDTTGEYVEYGCTKRAHTYQAELTDTTSKIVEKLLFDIDKWQFMNL